MSEGYITLVSNGEPLRVRAKRAQDAIERETGARPNARQALFETGAPVLPGGGQRLALLTAEPPRWARARRR